MIFFTSTDSLQQQKVKEDVSSPSPDQPQRTKLRHLQTGRRSTLMLRSSTLSMFSSSIFSWTSDYEEDHNCTRQLPVLKIIIFDILFSLVDNFTDLIQVNPKSSERED